MTSDTKVYSLEKILSNHRGKVGIQIHKHADSDALSSAFVFATLSKMINNQNPVILYLDHDPSELAKPNVKKVYTEYCHLIDEVVVEKKEIVGGEGELLVMVDCQPNQANTLPSIAGKRVVIDHHFLSIDETNPVLNIVHLDVNEEQCSATAVLFKYVEDYLGGLQYLSDLIYNGMYNDTFKFTKPLAPVDTDIKIRLESGTPNIMRTDKTTIHRLNRETLALRDIEVVTQALTTFKIADNTTAAIVEIPLCDNNLMGHISDLLTEIEGNAIVVTYFINREGGFVKLSVRSYDRFINASEIVTHLTQGIGQGGGGLNSAGGSIDLVKFDNVTYKTLPEYLTSRLSNVYHYYDRYEYKLDTLSTLPHRGLKLQQAMKNNYILRVIEYDVLRRLLGERKPKIRLVSKEGVLETQGMDLVIGIEGEVYPITEGFYTAYKEVTDGEIDLVDPFGDYMKKNPYTTLNFRSVFSDKGIILTVQDIERFAYWYTPTESEQIQVSQLTKPSKVLSKWGTPTLRGNIGDYLVVRGEEDIYIIPRDVFSTLYTLPQSE